MKRTLRALSALLAYPSAELQAHVGEIGEALAADGALPPTTLRRLRPLLDWLAEADLIDAQSAYSDLFDRSPQLSLHLFEHVHGESRERGAALVDLGQFYLDRGFVVVGNELPDYLPLFVEFASCLSEAEARELLGEPAHVLAALEERLDARGSLYAAVFHALGAAVAAKADPEALAGLRARAERPLDEDWAEAPVDFGRPLPPGGPAGATPVRVRAVPGRRTQPHD